MGTYDVLIRDALLVMPQGIIPGSIGTLDGRIAIIAEPSAIGLQGHTEIDAQGRYVLPGAIDSHSHIGQVAAEYEHLPGWSARENYRSETRAALAGGTTTALNYARFGQGSLLEAIEDGLALARSQSQIHIRFHGYLMNDLHLSEMSQAIRTGVTSFKIFMPYRGEEALSLGGISSLKDHEMLKAFTRLQAQGASAMVHAEDGDIVEHCTHVQEATHAQDLIAFEKSRPSYAEGHAALRALYLAQQVSCPVSIVHVSSGEAVYALRAIGYAGATLETCPHYLVLSTDNPLGPLGKVAPPLRSKSEQDKLWNAVADGVLDFTGSDHNVWPKAAKSEMWAAKAGLPGIGLILPLMVSEGAIRRQIPLTRIVELTSTNAAKRFGLWPQKGIIAVGSDADLVVLEQGQRRIHARDLFSAVDYSPYEHYELRAWPYATILGGHLAYYDSEFTDKPLPTKLLNG